MGRSATTPRYRPAGAGPGRRPGRAQKLMIVDTGADPRLRREESDQPMRTRARRCALVAVTTLTASALLTGCLRDGIHPIGPGGIATGVYHSPGARESEVCAYQRLGADQALFGSGFSGHGDGHQFVELAFTDQAFVTDGCEVWLPTAEIGPILEPGADVPPGTYRVGTDLDAGTYSVRGNAVCRWSRLRNARHDGTSVIDAGEVRGLVGVVTIEAGDAFFETRGCDPWRRIG